MCGHWFLIIKILLLPSWLTLTCHWQEEEEWKINVFPFLDSTVRLLALEATLRLLTSERFAANLRRRHYLPCQWWLLKLCWIKRFLIDGELFSHTASKRLICSKCREEHQECDVEFSLYLNAARYSASPMGGFKPPVHPMFTLKPSPAPAPTWIQRERETDKEREREKKKKAFLWMSRNLMSPCESWETVWRWQICVKCSQDQHGCGKTSLCSSGGEVTESL